MALTNLAHRINALAPLDEAVSWCRNADANRPQSLHLKGTAGSLPAFILRRINQGTGRPLLCLLADADAAAYLTSDLEQLGSDLLLLPPTGHHPYDDEQMEDPLPLIQRADVLQQLSDGFTGILVASADALYERVPPPETFDEETLLLNIGQNISPIALVENLVDHRFERVEFVEQPGEVALRGGLVDVFPYTGVYPIRVEFFGDEIDSLREFDVQTQRSVSRVTSARLVPNLQHEGTESTYTPLFEYLPADTLVAAFNSGHLAGRFEHLFQTARTAYEELKPEARPTHAAPEARYLNPSECEAALIAYPHLLLGPFTDEVVDHTLTFESHPQPAFHSNIGLLRRQIYENTARDVDTVILCDSRGQESRLMELLGEDLETQRVRLKVESLHEGFEVPGVGLALYTDHQIFNRYHRPTVRKRKKQYGGLALRDLLNLSPGDFVVHIDHGVGRFAGMQKITVRGKQQEAVRLTYEGGDVLFVNVNVLHKLHKFTGKEGHQPRLTKLGSGQWERAKSRTKKRVKDIARDLIKLYAQRRASNGHAFPPDTIWQRELEASFEFEDTPDQGQAAEQVKQDMEQPVPMDRLVCGDVGFGKTEIAVRAAFKAVQDGKQVAILVPTTILAAQHAETFRRRLGPFPVRIESLSRFRTKQEQTQVLKDLKAGKVDILIGTHRIVSKDVQFKDLGLLIIDEEQRFGVSAKERLRKLRVNVDTLTLTATPIPRTLQFSLLGARDLSIIATPPPNRQPIVTEIHTFDKDLIRDALLYEVNRGGQVFFIHNRVQTIDDVADMLRQLVPDIRIQVGHGQLRASDLERVMLDFIEKKFDVLVSTNIIENGLDISNANTIIINRADHFGLAELHQLRGRVGRADRKAFCYLLVPSIHGLTREARQRLQAVEEFSDLGSGFSIAMRDLDIRGAGNMLGAEQSGFINEVGYEAYHKILEEAVLELRHDEFGDLFEGTPVPAAGETVVDVEEDAFIPEAYLANNVERLNLYRRISEAGAEEELEALEEEMRDRFGPVPAEVQHLLLAARIKLRAQPLRLTKVIFKNERLFLDLPTQEQDPYFYDHYFHPLLEKLNLLGRRYVIREKKNNKLQAIVQEVPDLGDGLAILGALRLTPSTQAEPS